MRTLVFLLILANLLFFAWAQGSFGPPSNPDAARLQQQLNADSIVIVARDEPPSAPAKADKPVKGEDKPAAEPDAAAPEACVRLADLAVADGTRVEGLLAESWPQFKSERTLQEGGPGYWVYIGPLATRQDTDNKAAELKRLHVPELYVVQENGPHNRTISLGLFSTREAANARLEALRGLGVKSAKVGERGSRPASVALEIRGPQAQAEALRKALAEAQANAHLGDCRKSATP